MRMTSLLIVAVLAVAVIGILLSGCAAGYAGVKQAVIATDGAVVTTTTLRATNVVTVQDAQTVSAAAKSLLAAETAWKVALDAGDKNAGETAAVAVQAALSRLSAELLALQQRRGLTLHPHAALALAAGGGPEGPGRKGVGEVTAAIAILNLVADLTPALTQWINASTATANVTSADVQAAIDTLTRDIATLDAAAGG